MLTVYVILAAFALLLVGLSLLPRFEVLHKIATLLLALDLFVYFLERAA